MSRDGIVFGAAVRPLGSWKYREFFQQGTTTLGLMTQFLPNVSHNHKERVGRTFCSTGTNGFGPRSRSSAPTRRRQSGDLSRVSASFDSLSVEIGPGKCRTHLQASRPFDMANVSTSVLATFCSSQVNGISTPGIRIIRWIKPLRITRSHGFSRVNTANGFCPPVDGRSRRAGRETRWPLTSRTRR